MPGLRGLGLALFWCVAGLTLPISAWAEAEISICYNYGCLDQARIVYDEAQLAEVGRSLAAAKDAEGERATLAQVIGQLYAWAGRQSPIWRDKGGDYADMGEDGRMDCIDHAESTTRLLKLLESRGWLRFHRVVDKARRTHVLIIQHFSAVIEELPSAAPSVVKRVLRSNSESVLKPGEWPLNGGNCLSCGMQLTESMEFVGQSPTSDEIELEAAPPKPRRWAVDSWFYDNGSPAVILPLDEWLDGGGPWVG